MNFSADTAMNSFRSSSFNGRSRPNVVRPRAAASHSTSLLLVPREIEVTRSGFGRSMPGLSLMGGWSRQLQSTATTSLLPFATGAAASRKTFQRTIPAASRFSHGDAATDIDDILRSLRSIIDSEPPVAFGIPIGSPFEIFGVPVGSPFEAFVKSRQENGETVTYHHRYNGGLVFVEVEKKDANGGNSKCSATKFDVCILKLPECVQLMFCISALEGEIKIHRVAFGDLKCYDNPFDCLPDLRDFSLLDEDLQAAFYKFLAVRGITAHWYVENNVLYFR